MALPNVCSARMLAFIAGALALCLLAVVPRSPTDCPDCPVSAEPRFLLTDPGPVADSKNSTSDVIRPATPPPATTTVAPTPPAAGHASLDPTAVKDPTTNNATAAALTLAPPTLSPDASAAPASPQSSATNLSAGDPSNATTAEEPEPTAVPSELNASALFDPVPLHPVTQEERVAAWNRTTASVNLQGYAAVTALLDKECAGVSNGGPSVRGVLHGAAGVGPSAGWQRLWLVAVDAAGRPTCAGGDAFEVSVESADTRAVVDVVADLGRGLYELQVLLRRPGQFTVCSDVAARDAQTFPSPAFPVMSVLPKSRTFNASLFNTTGVNGTWGLTKTCSTVTSSISESSAVETESALVALRQQDLRCQRADALVRGEWRRVTRCTGRECAGDAAAARSDGWVWVSDVCVVSYFPRGAAWRALRHEFLLAWGDSTLKQPLANMVEYGLGVPLLKRTWMESRSKKKPGFFEYRQYKLKPIRYSTGDSFRLIYAWGGCKGLTQLPTQCAAKGVRNTQFLIAAAQKARGTVDWFAARNITGPQALWPTVIIANHFRLWASAPAPEDELVNIANGIRMLHHVFVTSRPKGTKPPLIVYMSAVASGFNDHDRWVPLHRGRAGAWALESMLATQFPYRGVVKGGAPSVRIIGRYGMTNPLHHGSRFVHTDVHYGATKGMCMTGMGHREHYLLHNCLRDTVADDVLEHLWLTALTSTNASGVPLPSAGNATQAP